MSRKDLQELLTFAKKYELMDKSFEEAINLYIYKETYEDAIASMIDASIEQHDLDFLNE